MEPLLESVEAVLFDLDGTLADTDIDFPLMKREMIALAVEHGLDSGELQELDILSIVRRAADTLTSGGQPQQAAALHQRAMAILEEIELRHARETREVPFARELIRALRTRGIKTGIVTRNCRRASEISLCRVGISPDVMVCREDSLNHKPHPQPLHLALEALGARPQASVMVGDHLMDIQGGKAAGMKTVGLLRESRPADFFDQVRPDFVARDLKEVLRALVGSDR